MVRKGIDITDIGSYVAERVFQSTEVLKEKALSMGWTFLQVSIIYRSQDHGLLACPYFLLVQTPDNIPLGMMALEYADEEIIPGDWLSWLAGTRWLTLTQIYVPLTEEGTIKRRGTEDGEL